MHHDPRHPRRAQRLRWEWERIILTGLVGVPACALYGIAYTSAAAPVSTPGVVAAFTTTIHSRIEQWAAWTGRSTANLGEVAIPVLGMVTAALLTVGVLVGRARSRAAATHGGTTAVPNVRGMLAFAVALAAFSIAYLAIGAPPLVVACFPLLLDGTNFKILTRDADA